ncbi:hypothetical protein O988_02663 [Pseudogymnoascus sp. VKM F-3808]|nr:hypothetical protein O988_02663 [Pseudogymnoascus sp. VKM F-3808]
MRERIDQNTPIKANWPDASAIKRAKKSTGAKRAKRSDRSEGSAKGGSNSRSTGSLPTISSPKPEYEYAKPQP